MVITKALIRYPVLQKLFQHQYKINQIVHFPTPIPSQQQNGILSTPIPSQTQSTDQGFAVPTNSQLNAGNVLNNESSNSNNSNGRAAASSGSQSVTSPVDILMPGGQAVGYNAKGASSEIRTVTTSELDDIASQLMSGATQISNPGYEANGGTWYSLPNGGGNFGIRTSNSSGKTIDLKIPSIPDIGKIHGN